MFYLILIIIVILCICIAPFFEKTVEEQEKDYIKKHGYPDENVIFCDSYGGIS